MRTWLFYKVIQTSPIAVVEFRRADWQGVHNGVPPKMAGEVEFHGSDPIDIQVKKLVRNCGWRGEPARSVDDPIAKAVLKGAW